MADECFRLDFGVFKNGECLPDAAAALERAEEPEARRLLAQQHVRFDTEVRRQHEFLVDHGHAAAPRLLRTRRRERPAVEQHVSGVRALGAAQHFHERRFAGAVLPDKGEHFAGAHFQIDRAQRHRRAETLVDAGHLQPRRRHAAHPLRRYFLGKSGRWIVRLP